MSRIEARGLSVDYATSAGPLRALDRVTFTVEHREIVSIVGPSGSGKTTLLLALAHLKRPAEGEVLIDGHPSREVPNVGVIFQEYNRVLLLWKDVQANVEMGAELRGLEADARRQRADKFIEMVGLGEFRRAYPHQLSGGMKQRVQIARILAYDPAFLLCDEPFGSVDAQTRAGLQNDLLRLWEEAPRTIVFVTHDVDEAIFMADRVIVMSSRPGRVIEELKVPFPRPRHPRFSERDPTGTPEFAEIRRHIWRLMGL
ncbi:MAG: ABC transporter ATP-binding protein [Deltaproteobacteria bacterium]|nr:ABC transporter ATP-binding protein [Deltaproteobacteria bacterium]